MATLPVGHVDGAVPRRDTPAAGAGAASPPPSTLHARIERAIDARGGVLPELALQRRQQLAAAAQRTLTDILKTVFGKRDDAGATARRAEHPPLTENETDALQARLHLAIAL